MDCKTSDECSDISVSWKSLLKLNIKLQQRVRHHTKRLHANMARQLASTSRQTYRKTRPSPHLQHWAMITTPAILKMMTNGTTTRPTKHFLSFVSNHILLSTRAFLLKQTANQHRLPVSTRNIGKSFYQKLQEKLGTKHHLRV